MGAREDKTDGSLSQLMKKIFKKDVINGGVLRAKRRVTWGMRFGEDLEVGSESVFRLESTKNGLLRTQ